MPLILVVEDEPELARLVVRELGAAVFGVRHVLDGTTALRLFEEQPPDLVVLDWMLPGVDGLEVLRRIRRVVIMDISTGSARLIRNVHRTGSGPRALSTLPYSNHRNKKPA